MKSFREIRLVLVYTMALNVLVAVTKLVTGYVTGTLSLAADGFHSLFDSASNVVGLVGIQLASRPPDPTHPYGHRKYETLSAVAISVFLLLTAIELVRGAVERLQNPSAPEVTGWMLGIPVFSMVTQMLVSSYEARRGRELFSEVLVADAAHSRSDVLVSGAVLAGMIVMRLGFPIVDALLPLVIAALIVKSAIKIISDTSKVLVDGAALDVTKVQAIALAVPGVGAIHNVRSRGQVDDVHLDLHVQVQPGMPVEQAHHVAHQVKRRLAAELAGVQDVIVHVEPQRGSMPEGHDLSGEIRTIVHRIPEATVHSVQIHEAGGEQRVSLHLEVKGSLTVAAAHDLASQLEDMLTTELPAIAHAEVHIEPAEHEGSGVVGAEHETYQRVEAALREALAEGSGLGDCHNLTVYRDGEHLLVSVHCRCDASLSVERSHALSSQLEQHIRGGLPPDSEVLVHVEPMS